MFSHMSFLTYIQDPSQNSYSTFFTVQNYYYYNYYYYYYNSHTTQLRTVQVVLVFYVITIIIIKNFLVRKIISCYVRTTYYIFCNKDKE